MNTNDQPNKFINIKSARTFCHLMASKLLTISHHWHPYISPLNNNISHVHSITIFVSLICRVSYALIEVILIVHTQNLPYSIHLILTFALVYGLYGLYGRYGVWLMSFAACAYLKFIVLNTWHSLIALNNLNSFHFKYI